MLSSWKITEFENAIDGAAGDDRCLIFKFPKGNVGAGWWSSVNANTNDQCKKANEKDKDVFQ